MIVSHRHQFIFLKTYKSAGSSLEVLLSKFCGPDDIVTRLQPEDEALRPDSGPRNYVLPFWRRPLRGNIKTLMGRRPHVRWTGYYAHMPAKAVRRAMGPEVWGNYLKITSERNPWDRQVSIYHWRTRHMTERPSFGTYLRSNDRRVRLRNFDIYSERGRIVADEVILYHDMRGCLERLFDRLNLELPDEIPGAKTGVRPESDRDYRILYTDETREMVGRWYAREIKAFGFKF